ncbi:MAG: hypothetical protein IT215_05615, partial [Chitinophagaceae bacterium]|nr:hypothetical protein [Chitinophagaceae bacterium]
MIDKNQISNELKELKINIPHLRMPERELPSSYFDELQNEILSQIEQSEIEKNFSKTNPFQAPETPYFENLHQQIIDTVVTEQFINHLPKQVPFHV